MSSSQSGSSGYVESLATKMDRLADALANDHVSLKADGVYVDVNANGHVIAVVVDEDVIPGGRGLGPVIAELINRAREQARAQTEDLVREVQADPRIAGVVEQIGDAPERAVPRSSTTSPGWSEDGDPYGRRSPIAAPDWD